MEKESKHNFRESGYIYGLLYRHLRGKHEKSIRRKVVKYAFNIYFDSENMQSCPNWGKRIPGATMIAQRVSDVMTKNQTYALIK